MAEVERLNQTLDTITAKEAAELSKLLEEKWGVSAAAPVAIAAAATSAETSTVFGIFLVQVGDRKLEVIKEVREITGLVLKVAIDLVERSPTQIMTVDTMVEAEKVKARLEQTGASIEIEPILEEPSIDLSHFISQVVHAYARASLSTPEDHLANLRKTLSRAIGAAHVS